MQQWVRKQWQKNNVLTWLVSPVALIFAAIVWCRRKAYAWGLLSSYRAPVPVIVVGNISIGGTGKTPIVIAMTQYLQQLGKRVGIVSRGYRSRAPHYPYLVTAESPADYAGDEAKLIALQTQVPVMIDADRAAAVKGLLAAHQVDVIISDDGLQHYGLARDLECICLDADAPLGNGWCLPAGPLREPASRLQQADVIFVRDKTWQWTPRAWVHVQTQQEQAPLELKPQACVAVAGIAQPQRFFQELVNLGLQFKAHAFADHYAYQTQTLAQFNEQTVLMTAKDAVKWHSQTPQDWWYLDMQVELGADVKNVLQAFCHKE